MHLSSHCKINHTYKKKSFSFILQFTSQQIQLKILKHCLFGKLSWLPNIDWFGLVLWCLMPLLRIFQLYRGGSENRIQSNLYIKGTRRNWKCALNEHLPSIHSELVYKGVLLRQVWLYIDKCFSNDIFFTSFFFFTQYFPNFYHPSKQIPPPLFFFLHFLNSNVVFFFIEVYQLILPAIIIFSSLLKNIDICKRNEISE